MSIELRDAPGLQQPVGFSHVSIASPGQLVHLAGHGGADADGNVDGDLAQQTERALLNLAEALDAAGAVPEHLVKLTVLVVGWRESMLGDLLEGFIAAAAVRPMPPVPLTLHGVQSLFLDSMLVEVEGVAVLPPLNSSSAE
jgi:enamine deaminase RidA (YjgF/YER057c/UK114 family)